MVDLLRRRSLAACAVAAFAVPWRRAQAKPEKARVVVATESRSSFGCLPLTIASQLGYFQDEGLEVEVVELQGASRAWVPGGADVVSGAFEQTIAQYTRLQPVQAFVLQARAPQIAMGVSTRALPSYQAVTELRGRRIGVVAPESSSHLIAQLVLARAGVRTGEVSFAPVGAGSGALAALRAGQIDALCHADPLMTLLEQKGELRIIGDTRSLKGTQEVFGGPMPASCLYAPLDWIQRHPQSCQGLAHAIVRSLKWLQTAGPSDIIKTVPEPYLLGDRALYLASFNKVREAFALDGLIPEDGARTALRVLTSGVEPMLRPERIELGRCYTNEFARRAKERFRA